MSKRSYRGNVQAEIAAVTYKRILKATLAQCQTTRPDQLTLEPVATRAGVAVQTILRHFGSKEGLLAAASSAVHAQALARREYVPPGDIPAIVQVLAEQYEQITPWRSLLPLQEDAAPAHAQWVRQMFAPLLPPDQSQEPLALLTAITDFPFWHTLRQTLDPEQAAQALQAVISLICRPAA